MPFILRDRLSWWQFKCVRCFGVLRLRPSSLLYIFAVSHVIQPRRCSARTRTISLVFCGAGRSVCNGESPCCSIIFLSRIRNCCVMKSWRRRQSRTGNATRPDVERRLRLCLGPVNMLSSLVLVLNMFLFFRDSSYLLDKQVAVVAVLCHLILYL